MKMKIKEVPVTFNSKKEFALALIEGRKFRSPPYLDVLHWKGNELCPFRCGASALHDAWDFWNSPKLVEIIENEARWEDKLKNRPEGIWCWVWDKDKKHKTIDFVFAYNIQQEYAYLARYERWKHAEPLTKEEIQKHLYTGDN